MYDRDCDACLMDLHYCPAENDVVGHRHGSDESCIGDYDDGWDGEEFVDLVEGEGLLY